MDELWKLTGQSFDELPTPGPVPETVTKVIVEKILDGRVGEKPILLELLRCLAGERRLPEPAVHTALAPMIEMVEDLLVDVPKADV